MKRFIRYLYEYEHGKRIRNVGFVKVEAGNEETTLHMQGKGFHQSGDRKLALYLFYEENGNLIGIPQAELVLNSPMMSCQLRYTPEDTGETGNYPRIQGILLETESGRRIAAAWDDRAVDVSRLVMWQRDASDVTGCEETCAVGHEEAEVGRSAPEKVELSPGTSIAGREEAKVGRDAPGIENCAQEAEESGHEEEKEGRDAPGIENCAQEVEESGHEEAKAGRDAPEKEDNAPPESRKIIKIQRQDIARLPRCEWKLANNRFLMHGYNNYRHLVLIQSENNWKLGVPGIYHINEARLAESFGFGEFLPIEEVEISLNKEERHQDEPFGYWCRNVRKGDR